MSSLDLAIIEHPTLATSVKSQIGTARVMPVRVSAKHISTTSPYGVSIVRALASGLGVAIQTARRTAAMTDPQRAREAARLLEGGESLTLKAVAVICAAYASEHGGSNAVAGLKPSATCEYAARQWCADNGFTLDYLTSKEKYPARRMYGKHMLRRHLYDIGYSVKAIAAVCGIHHTSVTASRQLPQVSLDELKRRAV